VLTVTTAAGCSARSEAGSVVSTEVTTTVTATATVTATVRAAPVPDPTPARTVPSKPRRLSLRVFRDGCGVIRGNASPDEYTNLTWVFRDADGFQVLGRNALNETRSRYFGSGTFTVALEAWQDDRYAPVSRTVTVRC
jgi:hypothetical protein